MSVGLHPKSWLLFVSPWEANVGTDKWEIVEFTTFEESERYVHTHDLTKGWYRIQLSDMLAMIQEKIDVLEDHPAD